MTVSDQRTQKKDFRSLTAAKRLLVSFPKSGRTWLRFALESAQIETEVTHAGGALGKAVIGRPYREIPPALKDRPVVFLHRNPIDTAVSFFYQTTRRAMPIGSWRWFSEWMPLALRGVLPPRDIDSFVLNPVYGVAKICSYNRLWLDHVKARGDGLVLNYENMRADSASGFQRLLDYWGVDTISGLELAERSSVEKMRTAELAGAGLLRPQEKPETRKVPKDQSSAKVRRAVVHGYLDELRPQTIAKCRQIAAEFGFDA